MTVALDRVAGTRGPGRDPRGGAWTRFAAAVRRELPARGPRWYSTIVRAVFDAATDPAHAGVGVLEQRAGALERVRFALADLAHARAEITKVEARMLAVLDELGSPSWSPPSRGCPRSGPRRSWPSPVTRPGSPAPERWSSTPGCVPATTPRAPTRAQTTISGRGRPELRLAAWRAVFAALRHNPVLAARHAHLTTRADNPLTDTQARVAVAGSLLRQLHAVVTTAHPLGPRHRRRTRTARETGDRRCRLTHAAPLTTGGASPHARRDPRSRN